MVKGILLLGPGLRTGERHVERTTVTEELRTP